MLRFGFFHNTILTTYLDRALSTYTVGYHHYVSSSTLQQGGFKSGLWILLSSTHLLLSHLAYLTLISWFNFLFFLTSWRLMNYVCELLFFLWVLLGAAWGPRTELNLNFNQHHPPPQTFLKDFIHATLHVWDLRGMLSEPGKNGGQVAWWWWWEDGC